MMLFIQAAHAADAAPAGAMAQVLSLLPLVAMFAIFYFLVLRPQQKRAKEHKAMINGLATGNEVVFAGGLMGTIKTLDGDYAVVSLNKNNDIKIQKVSIISVLPNGTLENLS